MEDRSLRFGVDPYRGQLTNIWQGTIICKKSNDCLRRRMVISADCDLTDAKGNLEFFSLDVVPIEEFVIHMARGSASTEIRKILLQTVREVAVQKQPNFASVSDEVLCDWVLEGSPARWAMDLPGIHVNDKDLLGSIQSGLNCLLRLTEELLPETLDFLLKCKNVQLTARVDAINKKLKSEVQSRLLSTRVDHYILPALPGEYDVLGHIVPFKSLKLMSRLELSLEKKGNEQRYVPIATCRPVLLQSLLQKMTNYFARIGLTNNFRDEQEAIVKTMMEALK